MAFPAATASVGRARHTITAHLEGLGCCSDSIECATLLTSELATNAVRHAVSDEFTLDVDVLDGTVHVRIGDGDLRPPTLRTCGPDDESGRGLELLDRLSARWGVRGEPAGKAVWFELPFWA
jgi:anti-sigma regulatory factor (Ser/Thr protein kinase)